jgi:hypothetical protein
VCHEARLIVEIDGGQHDRGSCGELARITPQPSQIKWGGFSRIPTDSLKRFCRVKNFPSDNSKPSNFRRSGAPDWRFNKLIYNAYDKQMAVLFAGG